MLIIRLEAGFDKEENQVGKIKFDKVDFNLKKQDLITG